MFDTSGSVTQTSSTTTQSSVSGASGSTVATFTIGSATTAVSTIESTYNNWVGPVATPSDTAYYREAHMADTCPVGFNSDVASCWAQCEISYPVECGVECIRQNDDCKIEVVTKVSVVFQSAMSLATFGLYGEFKLMAKGIQTAFKCVKEMANLVKQLTKYTRSIKVSDPQTSQAKLLAMLYQTDNVVFDLPVTIYTCLGIKVADKVKFADKLELVQILHGESCAGGADLKPERDRYHVVKVGNGVKHDLRLADRTWMTVADLRQLSPGMPENDLRVAISKSDLVLSEIRIVTNNCMAELIAESDKATAYTTRDTLRKTFSGIVEDLITSGTSSNGSYLAAEEYAYKVADKVASFYGVWDVTGITNVLAEYFQTICGPTKFIGDIDDGTAEDALGLTIAGDVFNSSSGSWTKQGDGTVTITFESSDTDDVTVNIQSGGSKIDEVDVAAGETVAWSSNVTALGGKTLYLDRWRQGIFGLPGTGGVSLLLWVPRATESGGNLQLTAKLNVS